MDYMKETDSFMSYKLPLLEFQQNSPIMYFQNCFV